MSTLGTAAAKPSANVDAESMLASTLLRQIRTDSSNNSSSNTTPAVGNTPTTTTSVSPVPGVPVIAPGSTTKKDPTASTNNVVASAATRSTPSTSGPAPTNPTLVHNPLAPTSMFTGLGGHHSSGNNSTAPHQGLSVDQINALQLLAAGQATAAYPSAAASSTSTNSPVSAATTLDLLRARAQQQLPVLQSRTPTMQQHLAAEAAAMLHRLPTQQQHLHIINHPGALSAGGARNSNVGSDATPTTTVVRKEQVEAALRSKPQRGRKREDLSEQERLELTRTRNREHARSTRIRKKARYQELVESEQQLEKLMKQQDVAQRRRRLFLDFVKLRCAMLQTALEENRPSTDEQHRITLRDLIGAEQLDQFSFECGIASRPEDSTTGTPEDDVSVTEQRMRRFDQDVAKRVANVLGKDALALLQYSVQGGDTTTADDEASLVAMDLAAHNGFANMEIYLIRPSTAAQEKVPIQHGVMQFAFDPASDSSDKLQSVSWSTTRDFLNELSDSSDLNAQVSHPSVVSLDPATSGSFHQESSVSSSNAPPSNSTSASNSRSGDQVDSATKSPPPQECTNGCVTSSVNQEETGGGPGMNII